VIGIGEIAVVANGETAEFEIGEQRLHVAHRHLAGGGIAHMADGGMALELADHVLRAEILADMAHAAMGVKLLAVVDDDARRLLAAMLEGVQSKRRQGARFGVAINAEDAAFLAEMVVVEGMSG